MGALFVLIGAGLVGAVIYGSIKLDKRAFERRNAHGVEEFASHSDMVKAKTVENLSGVGLKILGFIGLLCFAGGIVGLMK